MLARFVTTWTVIARTLRFEPDDLSAQLGGVRRLLAHESETGWYSEYKLSCTLGLIVVDPFHVDSVVGHACTGYKCSYCGSWTMC
jgi:hypothetical protein